MRLYHDYSLVGFAINIRPTPCSFMSTMQSVADVKCAYLITRNHDTARRCDFYHPRTQARIQSRDTFCANYLSKHWER
jgi:hypothetical protein